MLRLERMEISGFKSFGDRTEVRFPVGITAVVGPNGCGKSNLGDALNWVLGEQSAKSLRGKQMADVIFAGSRARKALGLAEVSLHLAGAEGLRHEDQGRIVVTRRLFRDGDSEYLLNGKRTRLKDIQELLHDARVGARTYATIEQGRIDQILNAKPKERRLLIEDAAGVSNYKHKRRLTEIKLEATQANLLRVHDIIIEVERQIRSLKRQAAKARRYRALRDELRAKERVRFGLRAADLDRQLDALRRSEAEARDAEAECAAALGRIEVELNDERERLERAGEAYREAAERAHRLEIEIDREESRIRSCRERITEADEIVERRSAEAEQLAARHAEAESQRNERHEQAERERADLERARSAFAETRGSLERLERELADLRGEIETLRRGQFESMNYSADLRNRLRNTDEAIERTKVQRERLEAEQAGANEHWTRLRGESDDLAARLDDERERVAALRDEVAGTDAGLREARERLAAESECLGSAREAEQSAAARLRTLEDVSTRFAGVSDGVRALLADGAAAGVRTLGVVADYLTARNEVESVADGYLEAFLPTVIVEDDTDVRRAAELLRREGAGRTHLISRSQPAGRPAVGALRNGNGELPDALVADPRVRGKLLDSLTLNAATNGVLADRVGDALLVESLDAALTLHRDYPNVDYLTPDGHVVYSSGVISAGGRSGGDHGLLAHNRRMDEARSELADATARTGILRERVEAGRDEVARLEAMLTERREAADAASRRLVELELRTQRSAEETERSQRHAGVLFDELSALSTETERLNVERASLRAEVEASESNHRELEETLRSSLERSAEREGQARRATAEATELRADLAAKEQRQTTLDQDCHRLTEVTAELAARRTAARNEVAAAGQRSAEARELMARTESELAEHLRESAELQTRTGEMRRDIDERQERLRERESRLRDERARLESRREATRERELERMRTEESRRHVDDLCLQELGLSASEAVAALEDGADDIDLQALEDEVRDIREKIDRIGPVNMTAIEEFTELEERHAFLTSQRQDLDQSIESLRETIRRINRTSRERFSRAFDAIRAHYQEIFTVLFNGGRADLRLEEEEDLLEAGVEILAQPPGKRLGGVHLLSGGEKALSAVALLFAIFRYQPSPFCLLDEVDAALDDANVGRFTRMVKEYAQNTQFILVTHNKLSMEYADRIYGVTMEEPGVSRVISLELQ